MTRTTERQSSSSRDGRRTIRQTCLGTALAAAVIARESAAIRGLLDPRQGGCANRWAIVALFEEMASVCCGEGGFSCATGGYNKEVECLRSDQP
jgi:hypothetical protein